MILNGKLISDILYEELRNNINDKNIKAIDISIGDDFGGQMYAMMKKKKIEKETGFKFESLHFDDINKETLLGLLNELNNDKLVNGIMLQLPLSDKLKKYEREILDSIDPKKDVDGLTTTSIGNLVINNKAFIPCTPKGIITLLKSYNINLEGKHVVILNRSNIVGKPLEQLFLKENATTTICHSHTSNLKEITKAADILVVALNKQEFITSDYIKDNAIVIDVGVHKNNDGKTVGDVNYDDCLEKISFITPSIGGVGPMTICMLAYNIAISKYGEEVNDILDNGIEKAKILTKKIKY